jgi:hypothetical protein
VVAASFVLGAPAAARAGVHVTTTTYPVGDGESFPRQIATGDFAGDGRLDLAVSDVSTGGGDFSVLTGLGAGRYSDALVYDAGHRYLSVATGDFDEDNLSDLVLATDSSNSVAVAFSNGDGSFDVAPEDVSGPTASVAVGDFNHDGHKDLAAQSPGTVVVRLGDGNGNFADPVSYGAGSGYGSVAVGDFDGNGRDDLVTSPGPGAAALAVLTSKPDGTFDAPKPTTSAACCVTGLSVADFNADGRSDLAVTYAFSSSATVFRAAADGTLGAGQDVAVGGRPGAPAVGDVNHDARQDLAVATFSGQVLVFRGLGDGGFAAPDAFASSGQFGSALGLDVNADGFADLVLGESQSDSVVVALNAPSLAPSPGALSFGTMAVGATSSPQAFTLVNDGLPPLVIRGVALSGTSPGEFRIAANGCGGRALQSGASCAVTLESSPAASGVRSAVLVIDSNAAEGERRLPLSAIGVAPSITARDTVAPTLTVAVRRQRLMAVARRGLRVTIGCSEACRLHLRLFAGTPLARRLHIRATRPIARSTAGLAAGSRAVRLTLSAGVRRGLRKLMKARHPLKNARLTLKIVATDGAGNATSATRGIRLRA